MEQKSKFSKKGSEKGEAFENVMQAVGMPTEDTTGDPTTLHPTTTTH